MNVLKFSYSSIEGYLGCFKSLIRINIYIYSQYAINIHVQGLVQTSAFNSFEEISRIFTGSYGI
jgi:hypothetical protein